MLDEQKPRQAERARKANPWQTVAILTAITACLIELGCAIFAGTAESRPLPLHPFTFPLLWVVAAIAILVQLARKLGELPVNMSAIALTSAIVCGIITAFLPSGWTRIEGRYIGVESRITLETHVEEGDVQEFDVYDFPLHLGYLHKPKSPCLRTEISTETADNEYVNIQRFLMWQSGVAVGFTPCFDCFPSVQADGVMGWVRIFFTAGPARVFECCVTGMLRGFPLMMLIQIAIYLVKREYVWSPLSKSPT